MENKFHAGFFIRGLALAIDLNLLATLLYFLGIIFFIFILHPVVTLNNISVVMIVEGIFLLFVTFDYFILTTYFLGGTVGKILLELKVTDRNYSKASLTKIIIRETIGRIISSVLLLGYLAVFFSKDRVSFHDKLAGTFVTRKRPESKYESLLIFLLLLGILIIVVLIPIILIGSFFAIIHSGTFSVPPVQGNI